MTRREHPHPTETTGARDEESRQEHAAERRPYEAPRLVRHEDLPETTGGGISGVGANGESF